MTGDTGSTQRLRSAIRNNPAAAFVTLAYGISWGIWTGGYLLLPPDVPFVPIVFLGVFGPTIAGVLTVWLQGESVRGWLRTSFSLRVSPRWILIAVSVPVLVYGISAAVLVAVGTPIQLTELGLGIAVFLGGLPTATLLSGGNEELGWRGYLLPKLQQRYDALSASLLVGIVWAGWHLPVYLLPLGLTNGPFALFVPFIVLFSIVYTWVYNSTSGNVLVVMVLHGSTNSALGIFAGTISTDAVSQTVLWATRPIGVFCVVAVLLFVYGRETLSADSVRPTSGVVHPGRSDGGER